MRIKVLLTSIVLFLLLGLSSARAALAGPHLTLSPASANKSVNDTFDVIIGVDSGTETSAAVDVFGTFDASKLEVVSMEKMPDTAAFPFVTETHYSNTTGKFDFACSPANMSNLEDTVIKVDLVKVTFKAKAAGVASMNFTCTAGSEADSNIFKTSGSDVIDCTSNQSGSYTISASSGVGGDTGVTNTPAPTATGELPRTGGVSSTIGLAAFGLVSIISALFLRLI